ncbi:DUF397 domain-containing protein [Streptomyces sp. NWU339]|uniref:DUF397 domain-containing protein n=1 Tax=Streptomyces sp. NWU339 TaxID=2185284 RepID=UPI000D6753B4|nr:DUF397 domain-containing protein [Streptomyces sp. NWU339]PWI04642.1 DUF397 domain-containing protein [Streptomyces sp. NWU339]
MSGETTGRNFDNLAWFKSSYSAGDGGECVEVAAGSGGVHVRDSKDKAGPMVSLAPGTWAEFVGFAARHTA